MKLQAAVVLGILSLGAVPIAYAQNGIRIGANLTGFEEAAPAAISTVATGQFDATINHDESAIDYVMTYANVEANVTQAHIHFGRRGTSGGISVWLCSNLPSPPTPANTQACPLTGGSIFGTITAANVVGPAAQGIDPGEFSELIRAIRDGSTYVNVHSTKFQPGEIRGQLDAGHSH
jgi:hypothetical protein